MKNKKGIVLLSSGLDSVVSLYLAKKECDVILALTFDYGQKASNDEIFYAKKISDNFKIQHKIIKLPHLKKVTNNALVNNELSLEFEKLDKNSMLNVWVPNRNGLFLNIAAMYADSFNIDYIIFGANKEEAETFSDNSINFINAINNSFKYSTQKHPAILAPLINYTKEEIIKIGIKENVDFSLIKSCYNKTIENKRHCGKCESCRRLYNAIVKSGNKDLINFLF